MFLWTLNSVNDGPEGDSEAWDVAPLRKARDEAVGPEQALHEDALSDAQCLALLGHVFGLELS